MNTTRKLVLSLLTFFILGPFGHNAFCKEELNARYVKFGHVRVYVITADLNAPGINVNLYVPSHHPRNGSFPHETFRSMVSKTHPTVAIDGTYYDTKTFTPVGTLVADGQMLQRGTHGVSVCFDETNHVHFYKIRDLNSFPWNNFKVVLSTGPTLVEDGHIHLFPRKERFHDPDLFRNTSRSALGITKTNKLLLVGIPNGIGLNTLAKIMKNLGATQAVCLDGGSSTALYYRGNYLIHPSRMLTNIFLIYEQKEARVSKE